MYWQPVCVCICVCMCDCVLCASLPQRFQWLQLQNIYYRDKKFSMEVYQSSKSVGSYIICSTASLSLSLSRSLSLKGSGHGFVGVV